ncbi:MAG: hypothetical protein F4181_00225 [Proteobacteria bacterium]|nr:hypothetical protein [Pseudomonadota bacterium]
MIRSVESRSSMVPAIVVAGLLAGSGSGFAHHSFSAHYDIEVEVTLEGVVTDYQFINPHVLVFLDVTNAAGEVEQWIAESNSPSLFRRRGGLRADSLEAGDAITLAGHPSRVNPNDLHISLIVFPDGTEFRRNAQAQGQ